MRTLLILLFGVFVSLSMTGQTLLFSEDFEIGTLPDSVTHVGTGTWGTSSTLYSQGLRSDSLRIVNNGDSVVMTTFAFSTVGNSFVMFYFDHICKIEFFDEAYIEVSNNNGATWTRLTAVQYQSISEFPNHGNKFTAASYPIDWAAGMAAVPANSWWKSEVFDISLLVANSANVMIRFVLNDASPGNTMPDNYAWFIDNIRVIGAFSELNPPIITMIPPIPQDTMFTTDPYVIKAEITDFSGVDTAYVVYTLNWGTPDTIGMVEVLPDIYEASIPFFGFGRTIHYKVVAIDGSAAQNIAYDPPTGTRMIYAKYSPGGTVTIGTGTLSSATVGPTYISSALSSYLYSNHISMFTPTEIGYVGALSQISWFKTNSEGYNLNNGVFRIYLKHTSYVTLPTTSGTFASELAGATLVYESLTQNLPLQSGWVDFTMTNPNAFVYDGTSNLMVLVYWHRPGSPTNAVPWQYTSTPGHAVTWSSSADPPTITYGSGSRPNITLTFVTPSNLTADAGIGQIVYPTGGVIANTAFDVIARVKNYGIDTLLSATVNWTLNGVLQSPYSWTGALLQDSLSSNITLGNLTLPLGVHEIKIWTDDPNGVGDMNYGNDTMSISFMACASLLSGSYTIGGTNPDFADFSSAMIALDQCGINGPVTFNVASGTYTEQVYVPFISGASASNPVIFQSATGDSTDVTLQFSALNTSSNYTLKFDGPSHVTLRKMTIQSQSTTNARVIDISGNSSNITIENCVLNGLSNSPKTIDAERAIVYSGGEQNNNTVIENNLINDGEHGIWLVGEAAAKETGTIISNNIFMGQTHTAVSVSEQSAPKIKHNQISTTSQVAAYRAVSVKNSVGGIEIFANNIVIQNALSAQGIDLFDCESDASLHGLIANNMVSINLAIGGSQAVYPAGVQLHNTINQKVYHNSVNMYGSGSQANASLRLYNTSGSNGIDILNNIWVNDNSGGVAMTIEGLPAASFNSDYNNFYSTGSSLVFWNSAHNTLSDWQTYSSKDANSFSIMPYFNSNTDLHTFNGMLNGLATPVPEVTVDIDGDPRNPVNPDPGADEFDPPAIDVALMEIIAPAGGCRMTATEPVTLLLKNTGLNTISGGLSASFRFNGSSTVVTENVTGTILSGDSLLHTFATTVNMDVYALGVSDTFELEAWTDLIGDLVPYNDTQLVVLPSHYTPLPPVVNHATIPYATSVTLTAISPDTMMWYATDTSTVELQIGASYTTPILYADTTFWVEAVAGDGGGGDMPELLYYKFNETATAIDNFAINPVGNNPASITGTGLSIGGQGIDGTALQGTGVSSTGGVINTGWNTNLSGSFTLSFWTSNIPPSSTLYYIFGDAGAGSFRCFTNGVASANNWMVRGGGLPDLTITGAATMNPNMIHVVYNAAAGTYTGYIDGVQNVSVTAPTSNTMSGSGFQIGGYTSSSNLSGLMDEFRIYNRALTLAEIQATIGGTVGTAGCASVRVPVNVTVGPPPAVDAGIDEVVSPSVYAVSGVAYPIEVRLKNWGTDTLISANITWALNTQVQGTFPWTGSLANGETQIVNIGSMTFMGGTYCIDAWTSLPNGVADVVNSNDTAQGCFTACLAGTFTIGPAATGTWDYNTFNAALNDLTSIGICGPVIFDVQPGTYTEQLTIPAITGTDAINTITFRGVTADSTSATLQYAASAAADNWVVRLDGAQYFSFQHLTFKATGGSVGRVFEFMNDASYNSISNSVIETNTTSTTSTFAGIYSAANTPSNYVSFTHNRFIGGYYGIYWYATAATQKKHLVFTDNILEQFQYYGAYLYRTDSMFIHNNQLTNRTTSSITYGIYCYYTNGYSEVFKNKVHLQGTSSQYGIAIGYKQTTSSNPLIVANNFVSQAGATGTVYGIYLIGTNYTNVYYNSVNIAGGSAIGGRALYQTTGSFINIVNNIFNNSGGGYAYYINTPAAIQISDYNNLYTSSSNLAYWGTAHTTLASLQSSSTKDANSHVIQPPFTSTTDLHLTSNALSALGTPIPGITTDIDGYPRSQLPTIGAHEIPLIPIDAGVIAIVSPPAQTNEAQTYPVEVTVRNWGTAPIHGGLTIVYDVNGGTPVSATFNDTIQPYATANFVLPSMVSPAGNSVICARTQLPGDTNLFNDEFCKSFFAIPLNDAMVSSIVGLEDDCNIGLDTISIWVRNLGVNAINSPTPSPVTVSYQVNGALPVVTETFTPILQPNDSVLFHFTSLADFSVTTLTDTFNVVAWIDLVSDNVQYNDTAYFAVISLGVPDPPIVSNTTIPYGTSVTLFAQSPDSIMWYATDTSTVELAMGSQFTTPLLYSQTTYWVEAMTGAAPSTGPYTPGPNIGPAAVVSASNCSTGPCSAFNDLNFGVCGTQLVWVSTSSPPSLAPHVNWIDYTWPNPVTIDGMTIHHASQTARFLTGATLYKWENNAWVDFHTFSNLPMQCENVVPFPVVTTTQLRITSFQMTGTGQTSNPNFREIEVHEGASIGCPSTRVPLVVSVSGQALCDVGVNAILQPVTALNLGSQENVRVRVINYGTSAQSNIPVSYQIDNNLPVSETIAGPIPGNDTLEYLFSANANLSIQGNTYQFKAWTGLACDNTPQNDTAWKSVTNLLPTYCISTATSPANQEIVNVTLGTMVNPSPASGAMYTNHALNVIPPMLSPGVIYPLSITSGFAPGSSTSQNCWVKVWIDYNRDGFFDPVTELVYSSATTSSNTLNTTIQIPFAAMIGNTMMRVVLNQTTSEASVVPCASYSFGETEDYMVTIAPQAACDAGVIAILSPGATTPSGVPQDVWIRFMNFGSDPIAPNTLSIAYSLNAGTPVVVAYPGGLAPGAQDSIQMPSLNIPMGNNSLCAYTILACDSNSFNNEMCKNIYGEYYTTLPYFDDFETANNWYKPTASVNWQLGTPSANIINSAHSGNKAWVTNLTGDYTNNANEFVYTPIFNFSGLGVTDTVIISFYHWLAMASGDYGQVQYTTNSGVNWANLGFFGDASGTNWYNTQVGGVHYFSQTNTGWMYSAYKLSPQAFNGNSHVQFRFRFFSNASVTSNGWAIDNFRLELPMVPDDVGVSAINIPLNDTATGSIVNATVTIKNYGTNPQFMFPVELTLNGVVISTETWSGNLPSQGTTTYTFVVPFTVPTTSYQLCAGTQLPGDPFAMNDQTCKSFGVLPAYHDVGISQIISPAGDASGNICFYHQQAQPWYQYDVIVRLENFGQNAQTSIPIRYTFYNGGPVHNETWTGNLAPNTHIDIQLQNQFMPNSGAQQVCVETDMVGDQVSANDRVCRNYTGVSCIGIENQDADEFALYQNVPNPANGTTIIGYRVPQAGDVTFGLVSMIGQVLHSELQTVSAGEHHFELDAGILAAGVYYYFIEFNGQRLTKKLVVNK